MSLRLPKGQASGRAQRGLARARWAK